MSSTPNDSKVVPYDRIHFPIGAVVTILLFACGAAFAIYNQLGELNDRISELRIANLEAITEMRAQVTDRIGVVEQRLTAMERR